MEDKPAVMLAPNRIGLLNSRNTVYSVDVEKSQTKEDLLNPTFWAHVAPRFRPHDEIKAFREDGGFYAHLLVVACDKMWAKVHILQYEDLTKVETVITDEILSQYSVKFRGPRKWSVLRNQDNAVLVENLHSEQDGRAWLKTHLSSKTSAAA